MRRRDFVRAIVGSATAWPLAARAQQQDRMRRIGVLLPWAADDAVFQTRMAAFLGGLQQLGWIDGRNVRIDSRWAVGEADLRKYVGELVALGPNRCRDDDWNCRCSLLQHARGGSAIGHYHRRIHAHQFVCEAGELRIISVRIAPFDD